MVLSFINDYLNNDMFMLNFYKTINYCPINTENLSWKKAFLWGNFIEHCKKAGTGSLGNRIVHVIIASLEFLPIISQIASIFEKLIIAHFTPKPFGRNKKILAIALTSKAINALYEKAKTTLISGKSGPWAIEFAAKLEFEAFCNFQQRKIRLSSNLSDDQALSSFVFELTNAISFNKHDALYQKAISGQIECEEYVKEIERVEHEGILLHHKVITEAINEMKWSTALDDYQNTPKDFETYWSKIKITSHADYYRKNWSNYNGYYKAMQLRSKRPAWFKANILKMFSKKLKTA